jgi:hypothetical protein
MIETNVNINFIRKEGGVANLQKFRPQNTKVTNKNSQGPRKPGADSTPKSGRENVCRQIHLKCFWDSAANIQDRRNTYRKDKHTCRIMFLLAY